MKNLLTIIAILFSIEVKAQKIKPNPDSPRTGSFMAASSFRLREESLRPTMFAVFDTANRRIAYTDSTGRFVIIGDTLSVIRVFVRSYSRGSIIMDKNGIVKFH